MSEVTINYRGSAIATMDASGTKTLQTEGKLCDDDIEIVYARPSGGGGLTYASGDITTVSALAYLRVTGLNAPAKYARFLIDDPSVNVGDGTLKSVAGLYVLGASVVRATNNAGSGYGYTAFGSESEWMSSAPTVYADDVTGQDAIVATATGFTAKAYSNSYTFKAGYTYNWEAWY